jgi:hypothetical protein
LLLDTPDGPAHAAAAAQNPAGPPLSGQHLQPAAPAAIASRPAPAAAAPAAVLGPVQALFAAPPGAYLGQGAALEVWISPDAGGWRWFVGDSPAPDQDSPAGPVSPASGGVDLLSVGGAAFPRLRGYVHTSAKPPHVAL